MVTTRAAEIYIRVERLLPRHKQHIVFLSSSALRNDRSRHFTSLHASVVFARHDHLFSSHLVFSSSPKAFSSASAHVTTTSAKDLPSFLILIIKMRKRKSRRHYRDTRGKCIRHAARTGKPSRSVVAVFFLRVPSTLFHARVERHFTSRLLLAIHQDSPSYSTNMAKMRMPLYAVSSTYEC